MERVFHRIVNTILRGMYRAAHYLYGHSKDFVKPFVLRHPRLHRFLIAIKDPMKELVRSPELMTAGTVPPGEKAIPDWLIQEWKEMNAVEPLLFPEESLLKTIQFYIYDMPDSSIGGRYPELCSLYGRDVTHVFLVPWLVRGGADLVTLNYIRALVKINPQARIVVITTLPADSPWAGRLPENTRLIEFGKMYAYLTADEQEKLLIRMLLQMPPRVVHNINSDLGYRIFVKYGRALATVTRLYACSFCEDVSEEGKLVGYPFMYLPSCFDCLSAVFSDNQAFLNKLHDMYSFDLQKMHVHYQPIDDFVSDVPEQRKKKERIDILWAGRLDRQKRPDILIAIAEKSLDMPFMFHVYGSALLDQSEYIQRFKALKNIMYHGPFDGLTSLQADEYDVFLYTTQWDGLPNILLEAISLALPVIAPDVGGIAELIEDGKTGFLVGSYDDAESYVQCLNKVYSDRGHTKAIQANALALLRKRHSREGFLDHIRRVPDYI